MEVRKKSVSLSFNKIFKNFKLKNTLKRVLLAKKSPQERALSISLGVFVGYLPLIGFQSFFLGILVIMKKIDKLSLFLGYQMAKLTPFPLFLWAEYKIGSIILKGPSLKISKFREFDFLMLKTLFSNFIIGGFLLAFGMMFLSFTITYFLIKMKLKSE